MHLIFPGSACRESILAKQPGTHVIAGMAMNQELRSRGDGESKTLDVKTSQTLSVQVVRT